MFDSVFGDMPMPAKFILAFVIVLGLIALATFAYRRFGGARIGGTATGRGRQPRLAVIDAASVDGRRRLVLIRRDNVEHLVLIGGPTDVVIEQNIVRAVPVAPQREAPARAEGTRPEAAPAGPRPEPRPMPQDWSPAPEPARGARQADTWSPAAEPVARAPRGADPKAGPALPPIDVPPRAPAADYQRSGRSPARAEPDQPVEMRQSPPTADVNLADMAQRLEAALRRPQPPGATPPRDAAPRDAAPRDTAPRDTAPTQRPEPRP